MKSLGKSMVAKQMRNLSRRIDLASIGRASTPLVPPSRPTTPPLAAALEAPRETPRGGPRAREVLPLCVTPFRLSEGRAVRA